MSTILRGAGTAALGSTLLQVTTLLYSIPVVRLLGPEKYGVIGLVNTLIAAIAPLALVGMGPALSYYLPRVYSPRDVPGVKAVVFSSVRIVTISSMCLLAGTVLFACLGARAVFNSTDVSRILLLLSVSIPLSSLAQLCEGFLRGTKHAASVFRVRLSGAAARLLTVPLVLWVSRGDILLMALCLVASNGVSLFFGVREFFGKVLPWRSWRRQSGTPSYTRHLLSFSWPIMVSQYVQVVGKKADVILIAHFLTNSHVGIYRPAVIISQLLWFVPQALTFLLFPVMNELLGEGKRQDFFAVTQRTMKCVLYANLPLAVVLAVLASNILSLLYGSNFVEGCTALRWLATGATLQSFYVTSTYIIHSQRRPELWMYTALGGMGTNVFLNILLIPRYGINGAAIATACSYVVTTIMAMATAAMLIRKVLFPTSVLGAVVLSATTVGVALFVNGDFEDNCLLLAGYAVAMAAWLVAFERRDMREAMRLVRNAADRTGAQTEG